MEKKVAGLKERWSGLQFWQKGSIVGALSYFVFVAPLILSNLDSYWALKEFLQAVLIFIVMAFGMFGLGFKLSERYGTYLKRGVVIGAYLPLLPLLIVAIIPCESNMNCFAKGYGVIWLVVSIPVLAGIGGLLGYMFEKFNRGKNEKS